jgi:hypothetical protein
VYRQHANPADHEGEIRVSYAQRIPSTLRICTRACNVALASMIAALSTCGAALPSPPGLRAASAMEGAATPAGSASAQASKGAAPCLS